MVRAVYDGRCKDVCHVLAMLGLMVFAGCTHNWDPYDPRLDDNMGGAGGTGGGCTGALTPCAGTCVDVDSDPMHCGSCSNVCPNGQGCIAGACVVACDVGQTNCSGTCVDTQLDAQHCGGCGKACVGNEMCIDGACQLLCGNLTDCGGVCTDTNIDPQHCGGCGNACGPNATCSSSQCDCASPQTYCGAISGCVDTQSDALNCGSCSVTCNMGDGCINGACTCLAPVCGLCAIPSVGSNVPQTINGNTMGASNVIEPSCVPPGAGEQVFLFTAPSDGLYSIDAFGSGYDVALSVMDQGCTEVACNDDTVGTDSQVVVNLNQNEDVFVVVDGYDGAEGDFVLTIQPYVCPSNTLGSMVPQTLMASTIGAPDLLSPNPNCADPGSPEVTYSFTAPADGMYTFDTLGSNFDTVLYILDADCSGSELACNDDAVGVQSIVDIALTAGQTVVVVVDGFGGEAGDYTLNVN